MLAEIGVAQWTEYDESRAANIDTGMSRARQAALTRVTHHHLAVAQHFWPADLDDLPGARGCSQCGDQATDHIKDRDRLDGVRPT